MSYCFYAREGYDLVLIARSENKLYSLKDKLEQGITVDALVNNAGFGDFGNFWEVDPKRQTDLMYLNAMTPVQLTRCFLPRSVCRKFMKKVNG